MTNISREQSTVGGTASDSPVMQGRNARENGHGRDSCPYQKGSLERQGWLEGLRQHHVGQAGRWCSVQAGLIPPATLSFPADLPSSFGPEHVLVIAPLHHATESLSRGYVRNLVSHTDAPWN